MSDSESGNISFEALLQSTARLEKYFDRKKIQPDYGLCDSDSIEPVVYARMRELEEAAESQILYITEKTSKPEICEISKLGAKFEREIGEKGIPVCSYFCRLQHEKPEDDRRTMETIEFTALVYSLICQLIPLLPESVSMDEEGFKGLDGTWATGSQALTFLDDLIAATRYEMIVLVIDSIEVLDAPDDHDRLWGSTSYLLKKFVEILLKHVKRNGEKKVKILFTGSGTSIPLRKLLDYQDCVMSDRSR